MNKIFILNVGGTFNKVYNEQTGELNVQKNNHNIQTILDKAFRGNIAYRLKGALFKDSLGMSDEDRQTVLKMIKKHDKVLIVHGTDTIDKTAQTLAPYCKDKTVVLTGAMQPYSIDCIEAVANFSTAMQFLNMSKAKGVFIGMHGLVLKHNKMIKNRKKGIFQCKK
jgi:L-asparaginase